MGQHYSNEENILLLEKLISDWESETVEFKQASNDFDTGKIGRYLSALSNEANLGGNDAAWLVFGVDDKTRSVVGTNYRTETDRLNSLKLQMTSGSEPSMTFRSIRVVDHRSDRVVMFEIPAAPPGMPISWGGHYYARSGESTVPLSLDKLDAIRNQAVLRDWTAQVVEDADVDDLSDEALAVARDAFAQKNSTRIDWETVNSWSDERFLAHAGLLTKRGLNRAAILLLGKPESAYLLSPHTAEITWRLAEEERAYEHFTIPFILATSEAYGRIRNYKMRLLPPNELVQREIEKYEQGSVLEAIHNCIAHQDYSRYSRIILIEHPDKLEFINAGSFFEGSPDEYAVGGHMPRQYRNPALVNAMTNLNMIDHLGYGIEKMNRSQAGRYLPLPEYDLDNPEEVRLTIYGRVVDEGYTRLLMQHGDLPFDEVLALDRVQKGRPISDAMFRRLKRKGLVEGKRPKLRVAAAVAEATGTKARYLEQRGKPDEYCMALVNDYLVRHGCAARVELAQLLYPHMPVELTPEQQANKVDNLLRKMRKEKKIRSVRQNGKRVWILA